MQEELSVIDAIPGLAWSADPAGAFQYLNQRWCEYTGLGVDQISGHGWQAVVHPEDLPDLLERWRAILLSGVPEEIEFRLRRFDGVYHRFVLRMHPLLDGSGRVTRWHGVNSDVEETSRRAEAWLAGENRLLEMIASGHPLSDVLTALCRFVEQVDPRCSCGVYQIDWSGPTFRDPIAPSLPTSYTAAIEGLPVGPDVAPCGIAASSKHQVIVSDIGSDARWSSSAYRDHVLSHGLRSVWSTPICSRDGSVLGTFCVYQRTQASPSPRQQELIGQVTHIASIAMERARAEGALKRSKAYFAEAQRLSSTGSFSWRVLTNEITWSDELYRIFGFPRAMPVRLERIASRVHPEDIPQLKHLIRRGRNEGSDLEHEHRLQMPDGSVKYLHLVARATRDEQGRLEYIGAIQDVTEQRLSDQALSKVRSELARVARVTTLGALTASIAHEVSQPLSGIITNASTSLRMLAADPPNIEGARETARRTIRDGHRASDVITRLRGLFSKKDPAAESVDLNEASREVLALSLSELQRSGVVLQTELQEELPLVAGDRVQLQQVILNLLRNAAEAMSGVHDRPRHLVIRTERDGGDRVRLSVQDAGIGLESASVGQLFDAFYTTKSEGMGIGLSVSRSIIESHHGRLWAAANIGPGATFAFSIPRQPDPGISAYALADTRASFPADAAPVASTA
jgi:PAS domain S-box-containing protein